MLKIISGLFLLTIFTLILGAPLYFSYPSHFDAGLVIDAILLPLTIWTLAGMIVEADRDYRTVEVPRVILEVSKFIWIFGIVLGLILGVLFFTLVFFISAGQIFLLLGGMFIFALAGVLSMMAVEKIFTKEKV